MGIVLSSKLRDMGDGHGGRMFCWFCPGCDEAHVVTLDRPNEIGAGPWGWNGSVDAPSFSPSVDVNKAGPGRCHAIITGGVIAFCSDSKHALAGRSVPMPDLPWWLADTVPPADWLAANGCTLEQWRAWYPLDHQPGEL